MKKNKLITQIFNYKKCEQVALVPVIEFEGIKLNTKIGKFEKGEKFATAHIFLEDGLLSLTRQEKKEIKHYECKLTLKASNVTIIK